MKIETLDDLLLQEQLDEFDRMETDVWADENVVDEMGAAFGLTYDMTEELHCGEKEAGRDLHRWELDPASSEDWVERKHEAWPALPWRHFRP
jgi:hypothetical protein